VSERAAPSADRTNRLAALAELLGSELAGLPDDEQLVRLAIRAVPRAEHAAVTLVAGEHRREADAGTDPLAIELGAVEFQLGEGPCFDRAGGVDVVRIDDLERDARWPAFSAAAVQRGVRSLLATRTEVFGVGRAVLTMYAAAPEAFTDTDRDVAAVLAVLLAVVSEGREHRRRADNLAVGLESSRQIGIAIGILMARELVTGEQAFERLRAASQRRHRKLREVAEEVARTGELGE
jgi:hypothetical protein